MVAGCATAGSDKAHIFGRSGAFIYGLSSYFFSHIFSSPKRGVPSSAIDIALWDIVGKVADKPVYQLLGGGDATALSSYASLTRYSKPALVGENVSRALGSGFRHLKLHEIDVDCVRAAREAAATMSRSCSTSIVLGRCVKRST